MADGGRLLQLDGLRGIAAIGVAFFFHAGKRFPVFGEYLQNIPGLSWLMQSGWSFVDLFFVISGFVFGYYYLEDWQLRRDTSVGEFIVARFARLWPVHIVLLTATLAIAVLLYHVTELNWTDVALSGSMLQILIENPTDTLNGPAWSLSVEAICYALFLTLAVSGKRAFLLGSAIALIAGLLMSAESLWSHSGLIGRGLTGFFAGLYLQAARNRLHGAPTWTLALLSLLPFVMLEPIELLPVTIASPVCVLLGWTALTVWALRCKLLSLPIFLWLGERSYAIYLCHIPIYMIGRIGCLYLGVTSLAGFAIVTMSCWAATLIVAHRLNKSVEVPARNFIRQFWFNRSKRAANALG